MEDPKKVLIVEDEPSMRIALKEVLGDNGYSVLTAKNGIEGYQAILTTHPDLIILDLIMPNMDGIEVLDKVREVEWGKEIPVIVLTNLDPPDDVLTKILEHKPVYYLIKSNINLSEIVDKVGEVI